MKTGEIYWGSKSPSQGIMSNFPQMRGWTGGVGDKVFPTGTIGDSSFRSAARLGWGWRGDEAVQPGSPAPDGAGVTESPDLEEQGAPALTSSHLMNLLPRRRVSTTVGGSSCSADAGPGARHSQAGVGSPEPRRGPDGAAVLSARPARPASGPAASAPACQPVCPGQTRESAGPGKPGRGGAGPQRDRPLPQRPAGPLRVGSPGGRGGDCSQRRDGTPGAPGLRHFWGNSAEPARGGGRCLGIGV